MKAPKSKRYRWSELTPLPDNPPISPTRINRLISEQDGYSRIAVGTPEVGDNSTLAYPQFPEETLFILDGNNRYEIARLEGKLDEEIIVKLWSGLTMGEMHDLCDGINDRRTRRPAERFLRACKSERRGATERAIKAIVEETGWRVGYEHGDGVLACTKELEWIWAGGRRPSLNSGTHRGALIRTLSTYEQAFGREKAGSKLTRTASVVKGLGAFWLVYPDADPDGLVAALKGLEPKELYDSARQRRIDLRLSSLPNGMIDVLRNRYNKGRRGGRLPERLISAGGAGSWSEAA